MLRLTQRLLPALVLILAGLPAAAWAPETRVRMADEAVRFMPASLRLALETHREPLLRGLLGPQADEDSPRHLAPWSGGTLDRQIENEVQALLESLQNPKPFESVAERFGRVAHFVLDAGFPPGVGDAGGPDRYGHFSRFCESRRERFPLVFYGHAESGLDSGDFRAFALGVMERARAEDHELARAYAAAGNPPAAEAFDDRSVPFAVGSLSYSRGVTDVVRVWLAIWSRVDGDLGRTPYLERKKPTAPSTTD